MMHEELIQKNKGVWLIFWIIFSLTLLAFFSEKAVAAIDPPIGKVYKIQEVSIIDVIMAKLQSMEKSGETAKMQEEYKKRVINTVNNPQGRDLPKAIKAETHYFDPSYTVQKDMYLPTGELMHKAGTVINPLEIRGLTKRYIFIDGSDKDQLEWAKQEYQSSGWRDKVVLVKGKYMDIMKEWKHPVYFDQLGATSLGHDRITLVDQFGITALPSLVYQEGSFLRVDSIPLN